MSNDRFKAAAERDEGVIELRGIAAEKLEAAGAAQERFAESEKLLDAALTPAELRAAREKIERAHGSAVIARNQHRRAVAAADELAATVASTLLGEHNAKVQIAVFEHQRAGLRRLLAAERAAVAELAAQQALRSVQTLGGGEPAPMRWHLEETIKERRRLIVEHGVAPLDARGFVRELSNAFIGADVNELVRGLDAE